MRAGRRLPLRARRRPARWPTRARAGSPRACAGPRGCVDTGAFAWSDAAGAGARPRRARHLRAARRDVHAPRGRSTAVIPRLAELRELGRDGDRADARRDLPGRARLGLRRRLHLRAAPGLRRARRARAAGRRGPRGRARRDPRRRLQPRRARARRRSRRSGRTSRDRYRHLLGRRRSTTRAAAACASGRSRTPSMWVARLRVDGLRLDAVARDLRRLARARAAPSSPSACAQRAPRRARHRREGPQRPGDPRARSRRWGHDAQWADDFHHALHALLTGERDGYYAAVRVGRRPGRELAAPTARAARRLRPEPRPGRQPRLRRPPAGRRAAPGRRRACSSPRSRRCSSWARSTASGARSSTSPTTTTRKSPRPRARGAAVSSPPSRRSAGRCPTRRIRHLPRSFLRPVATPVTAHYAELLALRRRLGRAEAAVVEAVDARGRPAGAPRRAGARPSTCPPARRGRPQRVGRRAVLDTGRRAARRPGRRAARVERGGARVTLSGWRATYRLQLGPDFGFAEAPARSCPTCASSGSATSTCRPSLQARPARRTATTSIDPTRVSEELGGEAALPRAGRRGLGVLLDIVPNHMAAATRTRSGPTRACARGSSTSTPTTGWHRRFFDIDELAGVRVEDPEVFETHPRARCCGWCARAWSTGCASTTPTGSPTRRATCARLRRRAASSASGSRRSSSPASSCATGRSRARPATSSSTTSPRSSSTRPARSRSRRSTPS